MAELVGNRAFSRVGRIAKQIVADIAVIIDLDIDVLLFGVVVAP